MIQVTRLNGREFVVNAELIKFAEETPDTVITLVHDEKLLVKESVEEVVLRVVAYRRELHLADRLGRGA